MCCGKAARAESCRTGWEPQPFADAPSFRGVPARWPSGRKGLTRDARPSSKYRPLGERAPAPTPQCPRRCPPAATRVQAWNVRANPPGEGGESTGRPASKQPGRLCGVAVHKHKQYAACLPMLQGGPRPPRCPKIPPMSAMPWPMRRRPKIKVSLGDPASFALTAGGRPCTRPF